MASKPYSKTSLEFDWLLKRNLQGHQGHWPGMKVGYKTEENYEWNIGWSKKTLNLLEISQIMETWMEKCRVYEAEKDAKNEIPQEIKVKGS